MRSVTYTYSHDFIGAYSVVTLSDVNNIDCFAATDAILQREANKDRRKTAIF